MSIQWIRWSTSWHAVDGPRAPRTLCGRQGNRGMGPEHLRDTLPAGKSCESCLRIVARRADA